MPAQAAARRCPVILRRRARRTPPAFPRARWARTPSRILQGARLVTRSADTRLPVPPGQRLPVPDGLRPSARGRGAAHRRRAAPTRSSSSRATAPPRPGPATGRASRARSPTSAPTRRTRSAQLDAKLPGLLEKRAARSSTCSAATPSSTRSSSRRSTRCGCARAPGCVPAVGDRRPARASLHEMRLRKEPARARDHAARGGDQRRGAPRGGAARRAGALRVRARGGARLHVPPARRRGPGLRDHRRRRRNATILHYVANDQPLARRRARADRRGLRARRLRLGRDAHLPGRRPLRRRAARASTRRCSTAQLAALRASRSRARRCPRSTQAALRAARRRAWSSSACSRATSTS